MSFKGKAFPWIKLTREQVPVALVLIVSFGLNIWGITWGLPNHLDWAIDSVAPFKVLRAVSHYFSNGWYDYYPPVHLFTLSIFYAPLLGYLKLSGGLKTPSSDFPYGLSDPLSTLTQLILISRIVSALMGVAIIFLVYLTVSELFDRRSALFSALIMAVCYPMVYYAHTANLDVPYIFWAMLAIYNFSRVLKYGGMKDYVLFAVFAVLSISTKDQAYGLFVLAPLPILWIRLSERKTSQPWFTVIFDKRHLIALIAGIATFVLAQNLIFNLSGFIDHVRLITAPDYSEYASTLLGRFQLFGRAISLLISSLTPLFFLCGLGGSFYCALKYPRYALPFLFLLISYYLTFINVTQQLQGARHILPIAIIMAFFGGKVLAELWHHGKWARLSRTLICLAFGYAAFFPVQMDLLFMRDPRYDAEQWMQTHFEKAAVVETFTPHLLHKFYPRFPSWVKVRSSKLGAGTHWEPQPADHVRLPNLYTGNQAADYIVLSDQWYGRFLNDEAAQSDEARVIRELLENRSGYRLAAEFTSAPRVPIVGVPIASKIIVFKKAPSSS